ncbi:MAG: PilZ domain-containing protein [Pseudomonadota bacterium]
MSDNSPIGIVAAVDEDDPLKDDRSQRRRVFKGIKILFNGETMSTSGVMKNISESGAYIELKPGIIIPDEITIVSELDGYKRECEVVRREGHKVAIRFVSEKQETHKRKPHVVSMINFDANSNGIKPNSQYEEDIVVQRKSQKNAPRKPVFGRRGS